MRKHHRIDTALRRLRQEPSAYLSDEAVEEACRRAGHRWRDRLLGPALTVHCFLVQVLHGNTAPTHVSLPAGRASSAAAYCRARTRLPPAVLQELLEGVVAALDPAPAPGGAGGRS